MEDEVETPETRAPEPEPAKVIPMQPSANVSNLFGNDDPQPVDKQEKTKEPEPLSLFTHRSEPAAEAPSSNPQTVEELEPVVEESVPSFSRSLPEEATEPDEPPVAAQTPEPEHLAEPATPVTPAIEMPAASPVSGPALAMAVAAAARLAPESMISRADRLAPAARRLQELHARMSGKAG